MIHVMGSYLSGSAMDNRSNLSGGTFMASEIDEITINYEEDEILLVKELDKVILSKGAWSTILFKYQQWDRKKEEYSPDRYTIRRFRKLSGEYKYQSKFNISSVDQARKIISALQVWIDESEAETPDTTKEA